MVHGGDPQRGQHGKQSFRLKFSADDPFGEKHGVPFNFPKSTCNNMRKLGPHLCHIPRSFGQEI